MMRSRIFILLIILLAMFQGCGGNSVTGGISPEVSTMPGTVVTPGKSNSPAPAATAAATPRYDEKVTGVINEVTADIFRSNDVQSERVTQALYNQPVKILQEKEGWLNVQVVDGYTGWIKSKFVERSIESINKVDLKYKIVVTAKTKKILSSRNAGGTVKEVAIGTELFSVNNVDNWFEVILPEKKTGWIDLNGAIQLAIDTPIPKTTAEDFLRTIEKFKGVTYLWGGVSPLGLDCSGLTYICSRVNGVILPRDAEPQYSAGVKVEKDNIKPGDLVFFSSNEDLKGISHVGIYIGGGQFMHASQSKGCVITTPLNDEYFQKRLVGIRRFF